MYENDLKMAGAADLELVPEFHTWRRIRKGMCKALSFIIELRGPSRNSKNYEDFGVTSRNLESFKEF